MFRKPVLLIAAAVIIVTALSLIGCENGSTDSSPPEPIQYAKKAVTPDIGIQYAANLQLYEDRVYCVANAAEGTSVQTVIVSMHVNGDKPEYRYTNISISPHLTAVTANSVAAVTYTSDKNQPSCVFSIMDSDGNMFIAEKQVSDLIKSYNQNEDKVFLTSSEDRIYLASGRTCVVLSEKGEITAEHTLSSAAAYMQAVSGGGIYIIGSESEGNKIPIYIIQSNGRLKTEEIPYDDICRTVNDLYYVSDRGDIYFCTDTTLYKLGIDSKKSIPLCELSDIGISAPLLGGMVCPADDNILLCGRDILTDNWTLWKLGRAAGDASDERTTIRVSYMEDGTNLVPSAAIRFNSISAKYRVVCEEYRSMNESAEYNELMSAYDKAILTGDIGDVLILSPETDYVKYASKGVFADLYEVIKGDPDFSPDELFGCVKKPYETGGKLYVMIPEFTVSSLVGKTKNIPDAVWNIETMLGLTGGGSTGGSEVIGGQGLTRDAVFNRLLSAGADEFIDFESGSCSFDSGSFVSLLEYIAAFPEVLPADAVTVDSSADIKPYVSDEVLFYEAQYLGCMSDYLKLRARFGFENEISMAGYPSKNGGAVKVNPRIYCAVSSKSENPGGAWEFIKYMMSAHNTVDTNRGMRYIPSLRKAFDLWMDEEAKLYYFIVNGTANMVFGIEPFDEKAMRDPGYTVRVTDELSGQFAEFIDGIENIPLVDSTVMGILREEAGMFFSGDKSAEDTAKVIQSRVGIYLSERK